MGSKDTTKLNIQEDISVLNDKACEQSKNLALVLEEASKKHNTDVFVVEKPARFDREAKDPEGIRSVLTVSSNGILPSLITPMKRVHFIPLPSLTSKADRDCFSRDGVHLTRKGEQFFHLDLVAGVKAVYDDLNLETFTHPNTRNFQKDGKYQNGRSESRHPDDSNKTTNPRYHNRNTGRNTRYYDWNNKRDIPRGWRGYSNPGRYHRDNHNHTQRRQSEQQYQRYRGPQYRQPGDDRRQYRDHVQDQYRYSTDHSQQYRYRDEAQMDRAPYSSGNYRHSFVRNNYPRY